MKMSLLLLDFFSLKEGFFRFLRDPFTDNLKLAMFYRYGIYGQDSWDETREHLKTSKHGLGTKQRFWVYIRV